jgi:hypothetical protein
MKNLKKIILILIAIVSTIIPLRLVANDAYVDSNSSITVYSNDEEDVELANDIRKAVQDIKDEIMSVTEDEDSYNNSEEDSENTIDSKFEKPYLGVYTSSITLDKAKELGYHSRYYGVLITGTSNNSPARLFRLVNNDILMSINDTQILNDKHLSQLIESYYVGDVVTLELFRDGKVITMDVELGSRNKKYTKNGESTTPEPSKSVKTKHSTGFGGGTWMPIWYQLDMDDINGLITNMHFSPLDDEGIFLSGGGGKITIGKGYFLGLMGADYSINRKTNVLVGPEEKNVIRRMSYKNNFWGFSLDKRYAISSKIIFSPGFMIGGASQRLSFSQTDGDYDWGNLNNDMNNNYNSYASFKKTYIAIQPRAEIMYRLLSWLAIRGEVGYLYGYSLHQDWKTTLTGDTYETKNSPNTPYKGLTFSIGPWFGF